MTKRVILVRHAAPRVDPVRAAQDWQLSEEGLAAASGLRGRLPDDATLAASDEPKAGATLRAATDADFVVDARFGEVRRPVEPISDDFRAVRRAWVSGLPTARHRGWETPGAAAARFADGLDELGGEVVVVATHGMVLTAWLVSVGHLVAGAAAADFWSQLALPDLIEVDLR
ncbi:histidine phosphatase family protein [Flexivirga sp. B27]